MFGIMWLLKATKNLKYINPLSNIAPFPIYFSYNLEKEYGPIANKSIEVQWSEKKMMYKLITRLVAGN